jgi:archaemetzincin
MLYISLVILLTLIMKKITFLIIIGLFICVYGYNKPVTTIYIQPLGNVKKEYINAVKQSLESFYHVRCIVLPETKSSSAILAQRTKRIDASKVLSKYHTDNYTLILTEKDICTYKSDTYPEWGIFGLANKPGKTSVVSSYRLVNSNNSLTISRLQKVSIHEVGHNLGLNHCTKDKRCLMSAAGGTVKQVDQEEIYFCNFCKQNLIY